jgi:hypothetical protein
VDQLPPTPHERLVALTALEVCLAHVVEVHARLGDEPNWGLPPEFYDEYSFTLFNTLRDQTPTLADVSRERLHDWAEKNVDGNAMFGASWTTPPDDFIDNVGRMRAHSIVIGAAEDLVQWFRQVARDHLTDAQRSRVVELLKEATPHLPWRQAIVTVPAILHLGGPQQRAYFDRLARNPNVHEKTREEAASVRWLIDRDNPPT